LIRIYLSIAVFFWSAGPLAAQHVTVKRIDARPPSHPLDTGSDNDPILDSVLLQSYGTGGGSNTGACVIRVPEWIPDSKKTHPDANYYLYFSAHHGKQIRLAWSDSITGRWRSFNGGNAPDRAWGAEGNYTGAQTPGIGVLDLVHQSTIELDANTIFGGPKAKLHFVDVFVDDFNKRIIMYYHGSGNFVATSKYGLNFNMPHKGGEAGHGTRSVRVTEWYLRSFEVEGEAGGRKVLARFGAGRGSFWRAPLFNKAGEPNSHANADTPGGWFNPSWKNDPTPEHGKDKPQRTCWWTKYEDSETSLERTLGAPELHNPEVSLDGGRNRKRGKARWARHWAFYHNPEKDRNRIYALKTVSRELPESVCLTVLDLSGLSEEERLDPGQWKLVHQVEQVLIKPEAHWEGLDRAYKPSNNGVGNGHHLRDPYVFEDVDGKLYLFYSGKGEANIGVAELLIEPEPPKKSLRVTAPHAAHPILAGNIYPIGWWSHGGINEVDIEYSVNGKDWVSIEKGAPNNHRYIWTVPDAVSDAALVRVSETGGGTLADSEPFIITADKAIGIVHPRKGDVYTAGMTHYPAYCSVGDMDFITFEYSVDGGPWIELTEKHPNKVDRPAQWNAPAFAWNVPSIDSDNVRLRVSEAGGKAATISERFSIKTAREARKRNALLGAP
jgi:hypothetical protein